jgi:tripartite-type tricarboxylate transporter receptor subunit TctC
LKAADVAAARTSALTDRARCCVALAASVLVSIFAPAAEAQRLSDRAVKLVVPTTPGSSMDFLARIMADEMKQRWDQSANVENRAGASHTIAIQMVARAEPDGHTLLMGANTLATNVGFFKTMPYDPVKSLTPIAEMAGGSLALAVHPSVPVKTVREFVEYAKRRPGELNYGTNGRGTPQHLSMEFFSSRAGIKMTHVPYPGSAGVAREIVGGFVNVAFIPVHQTLPLAQANQIRLLAVSGKQRFPQIPDVPTLAEAGYEGVEVDFWYGLLGPAGLPSDIVTRYNTLANEIVVSPRYRNAFEAQGLRPAGGTASAFADLIAADVLRWTKIVKDAGLEPQ